MRVLIPVLEPVHKNCDIIALVLDTDMNYDSNTPYNKCSHKNTKTNSYDIIKNCGIIYMGLWNIWKPLLVHIIRINIYNKGKT